MPASGPFEFESRMRRLYSQERFAVVEPSENLLLAGPVFRDGPADPSGVHEVLNPNVFTDNVAPPSAAAEARRHRHAVCERPSIAANLRLADHDAADGRHKRKLINVVVIEGIDAARVAFSTDLKDHLHHFQCVIETYVFEDRQNR